MDDKEDVLNAMYAQDDEEETTEKRPQPEQLRLAGKATVITYAGKQIAIPRIDYVERLEATIRAQDKLIEAQAAQMKKMEIAFNRVMNNANRNISALDTDIANLKTNRRWE